MELVCSLLVIHLLVLKLDGVLLEAATRLFDIWQDRLSARIEWCSRRLNQNWGKLPLEKWLHDTALLLVQSLDMASRLESHMSNLVAGTASIQMLLVNDIVVSGSAIQLLHLTSLGNQRSLLLEGGNGTSERSSLSGGGQLLSSVHLIIGHGHGHGQGRRDRVHVWESHT